MKQKELLNEIIRASAGSGKTYELVRRYLRLLALGEAPEGIVAMTFTRKAAREFFERILQKLAELASNPQMAVGYVDELAEEGRAMALLRGMLDVMDRLKLGTIDSFFATVTRCFPFELGLSAMATVMDEDETADARHEVLRDLLHQLGGAKKEEVLKQMLEAWKWATMGKELNAPAVYLSEWFEGLHPFFLEQSRKEAWGGLKGIWPRGDEAVWRAEARQKRGDLEELVQRLRDHVDLELYCGVGERKWVQFFDEVLQRLPGEPFDAKRSAIGYMMSGDRGDRHKLRLGATEWKLNRRKPELSMEAAAALAEVFEVLIGRELLVKALRTQGRWELLRKFEESYAKLVRGRGRLAFADLTWLLSRQSEQCKEQERLEELRREWEYRLDSKYQHWLFDEFQDTSRLQWKVMKSLVEEAAMDPEGRRSFFVVGDLKQSLYVFRQAEPELFLKVEEDFKDVRMEKPRSLTTSYRSCMPVLEMVNAVFKQEGLLKAWFRDAMKLWEYEEHHSAAKVAALPGCGVLLALPKETEDKAEAKLELVTALIAEIEPLKRGLSCAVLTRTNREAEALSAELRRRLQIEVVCESKVQAGVDNPLTLLLVSLLKFALHPGDTMAFEHLRMSPLREWMENVGDGVKWRVGREVRKQLAEEGFVEVVRRWEQRIRDGVEGKEWDAFTEMRLAQVLDLAAEFDEDGRRDVDEFIAAVQGMSAVGVEQGKALQVMTFHKSKGLEFDVVIMPEIYKKRMDEPAKVGGEDTLLTKRSEGGELEWLLDPPQQFWRDEDETLKGAYEAEKARLAYQSLCRLYVGMTRAKRGLYVVVEDITVKEGTEVTLVSTLGHDREPVEWEVGNDAWQQQARCCYLSGERDWYLSEALREEEVQVEQQEQADSSSLSVLMRKMQKPVTRKSPSGQEAFHISGEGLLSDQRENARQMGLLVHDLFSMVSWLGERGLSGVQADWEARGWHRRQGYQQAAESVLHCLQEKEIKIWFESGQHGKRSVWCERAFDYFSGRDWVSGVMDRVVFEHAENGEIVSATVLDFKTDVIADDLALKAKLEGYRPQLKLYADAVAKLAAIPVEKVSTGLIFVSLAKLEWLSR